MALDSNGGLPKTLENPTLGVGLETPRDHDGGSTLPEGNVEQHHTFQHCKRPQSLTTLQVVHHVCYHDF